MLKQSEWKRQHPRFIETFLCDTTCYALLLYEMHPEKHILLL